jgi:hypothetical protein
MILGKKYKVMKGNLPFCVEFQDEYNCFHYPSQEPEPVSLLALVGPILPSFLYYLATSQTNSIIS